MNPQIKTIDFNERPCIAIWEVTRACDLACVQCRASAKPDRHPLELSTDEAKHLIAQISALKVPVFVGFVFISHKGEVFPSGFLPLTAGNNPHAEEPCCSYVPKGYVQSPLQMKTASTLHVLPGA